MYNIRQLLQTVWKFNSCSRRINVLKPQQYQCPSVVFLNVYDKLLLASFVKNALSHVLRLDHYRTESSTTYLHYIRRYNITSCLQLACANWTSFSQLYQNTNFTSDSDIFHSVRETTAVNTTCILWHLYLWHVSITSLCR